MSHDQSLYEGQLVRNGAILSKDQGLEFDVWVSSPESGLTWFPQTLLVTCMCLSRWTFGSK